MPASLEQWSGTLFRLFFLAPIQLRNHENCVVWWRHVVDMFEKTLEIIGRRNSIHL